MAQVSVYNMKGETVGTMELDDAVFGVEVNEHLVHQAVVQQQANDRQGTQSAKTRSEVSGGGKKPWRQKGTGHARQGSTRAPQWTHGGIVFAPKPRDYSFKMNKKEKRLALKSALTSRVQEKKLIVLDDLKLDAPKTKDFQAMLTALQTAGALAVQKRVKVNRADKNAPKEYKNLKTAKALVVLENMNQNVILSARNLKTVKTAQVGELNVYDILKYDTMIASQAAVKKIQEVYA